VAGGAALAARHTNTGIKWSFMMVARRSRGFCFPCRVLRYYKDPRGQVSTTLR